MTAEISGFVDMEMNSKHQTLASPIETKTAANISMPPK